MFEFDLGNFKIRFPGYRNISEMADFIDFILETLMKSIGIGLSSVILYFFGKSIGGKLYSIYGSQHGDLAQCRSSLEDVNNFLVDCLREWKFVKDAVIFNAISNKNVHEVVCKIKYRVNGNPCLDDSVETRITLMAFFFYRGIISGYYESFFNDSVKIRRITVSSDDDNVFCEFIVELPPGGLDVESGEL